MSNAILTLSNVTKSFPQPGGALEVLRGIDLSIAPGEVVALVGSSGSGKTTLLQIAGLLGNPTGGTVMLNGKNVTTANDAARTKLRRDTLGFVYQFHHLLPEFTAAENIVLPQIIAGVSRNAAMQRAESLLAEMGLAERAGHRPGQLSGGEQQRVAIARALANDPALLLADEPTGNLDETSSELVFGMLMKVVQQRGMSALIVTHNPALAQRMHRQLRLVKGLLE